MSRVVAFCVAMLLAGCGYDRYGAQTVSVVLSDGREFIGSYTPVSLVAFPPGPPVDYTMGPAGAVTRQQALLVGDYGEIIVCRFDGAGTGSNVSQPRTIVCVTRTGETLDATETTSNPAF